MMVATMYAKASEVDRILNAFQKIRLVEVQKVPICGISRFEFFLWSCRQLWVWVRRTGLQNRRSNGDPRSERFTRYGEDWRGGALESRTSVSGQRCMNRCCLGPNLFTPRFNIFYLNMLCLIGSWLRKIGTAKKCTSPSLCTCLPATRACYSGGYHVFACISCHVFFIMPSGVGKCGEGGVLLPVRRHLPGHEPDCRPELSAGFGGAPGNCPTVRAEGLYMLVAAMPRSKSEEDPRVTPK